MVAAFAAALVLCVGILSAVLIANEANRDWYTVATVNGVTIDRATLRRRVAFEEFLYSEQTKTLKAAAQSGHLSASEAGTDEAALTQALGDPVETARSNLVDEALVGQLVKGAQVTAPAVDPWTTLATFLVDGIRRDLRWVDFSPTPGAPPSQPSASIGQAEVGLRAGTAPSTVAQGLSAAGSSISGSEHRIGVSGPVEGIDDGLLAASRSAVADSLIGPLTTRTGDILVGYLASVTADDPGLPGSLAADAQTANIDSGTVAAWARAQTLETALRQKLLARWLTTPTKQVRGQEYVVGPAAVSGSAGPWVDLVALDPSLLGPTDLPSPLPAPPAAPSPPPMSASASPGGTQPPSATALPSGPAATQSAAVAAWLRAQPINERLADILRLARAANATTSTSSDRSGELGYLTQSQVVADVGAVAFAPERVTGDVLGPIEVGGHPLLFYLEARYQGSLDDRSAGALAELQAPGADPAALAAKFAPDRAALAIDSGWWSVAEFASNDPTVLAFFGTPIGALSDPVVLAGDLALLRPTATRSALPDPAIAARLTVEGYASWFANARSGAQIVLAANPLPEAYPSTTPGSSAPPTIPPLPTPVVPSLPGAPVGQPSQNPFVPPTLPGGAPGLPSFGP